MSTRYNTYRRELTPGIILEATLTEFREGADKLDSFTLTAFGQVVDLLPDALKGTEEAFGAMAKDGKEAALLDVVDPAYLVASEALDTGSRYVGGITWRDAA